MDTLNTADWLILIVVTGSTLVSVLRGFVREVLSLISWVLALVLALSFSDRLASMLVSQISDPVARYIAAFVCIFLGTLVIGALFGKLMRSLVEMSGLSLLDRVLGMLFGAARGILILLAAIVVLRPALDLDQTLWWRESLLLPHLLLFESWFRNCAEVLRDLFTQIT